MELLVTSFLVRVSVGQHDAKLQVCKAKPKSIDVSQLTMLPHLQAQVDEPFIQFTKHPSLEVKVMSEEFNSAYEGIRERAPFSIIIIKTISTFLFIS